MKLELHHINLCSDNVERLDSFYETVMGLKRPTSTLPDLEKKNGVVNDVHFRTDGAIDIHIAERDLEINFRTRQFVNPLERGHIAFRTDDIQAFIARLEENKVPYSDYKGQAVKGWHQIFFYDPDGNVIEVHQALDE